MGHWALSAVILASSPWILRVFIPTSSLAGMALVDPNLQRCPLPSRSTSFIPQGPTFGAYALRLGICKIQALKRSTF